MSDDCKEYCDLHHRTQEWKATTEAWKTRADVDIRKNCVAILEVKEKLNEFKKVEWEQTQQRIALEATQKKLDKAVDKLDKAISDLATAIKADYVPAARFVWVEKIAYAVATFVVLRVILNIAGYDI